MESIIIIGVIEDKESILAHAEVRKLQDQGHQIIIVSPEDAKQHGIDLDEVEELNKPTKEIDPYDWIITGGRSIGRTMAQRWTVQNYSDTITTESQISYKFTKKKKEDKIHPFKAFMQDKRKKY